MGFLHVPHGIDKGRIKNLRFSISIFSYITFDKLCHVDHVINIISYAQITPLTVVCLQLKVPPNIVSVLEKQHAERTTEDIGAIGRMMRHLPSFRNYTKEMQQMMCRIVRYMK